jgi:hypothetical protein
LLVGWLLLSLGTVTPAATSAEKQGGYVECRDGLLSVSRRGVVLSELLAEVARQCGFPLVLIGTVEREVSVSFRDLPVQTAFRRIFEGYDYVIEQSAPTRGQPVTTVRVLGAGATVARMSPGLASRVRENMAGHRNLDSLRAALERGDPDAREDAIHALGESGHPDAAALLAPALVDPDDDVRAAAFLAMGEIGGAAATRALTAVLADHRGSVRVAAVEALAQLQVPGLATLLVPALQDPEEEVRESAMFALVGLEEKDVVEALGTVMTDNQAAVRQAAVEGLAGLESSAATALLRRALADSNASVREAAAEALESRVASTSN